MNPTARLACLALSVVLLAACQRSEPADESAATVDPVATAAPAATPADDASKVVSTDNGAMDAGELDLRAFAGTFNGTLPCPSCPGIETELTLSPDGTFAMTETYIDQTDGAKQLQGTWAAEEDGARLRLDPDSKSENDRVYEIVSNDEVRMLDLGAQRIESGLDYSLRRSGANM